MALPTLQSGSVVTINNANGSISDSFLNIPLSAAGNNRVVIIACMSKDNSAVAAAVSTIALDALGVNATLANGKIVRIGTSQVAQESSFTSICDVFYCLETNLPTSAASYTLDTTLTSGFQYNMWVAFELTGATQAIDAFGENLDLVNVAAGIAFSDSVTTIAADCIVLDFWGTSHSAAPLLTTSQTQVSFSSNTNGAATCSQINRATAGSQTMTEQLDQLHQRRAWKLVSVAGISAGGAGIEIFRRRIEAGRYN